MCVHVRACVRVCACVRACVCVCVCKHASVCAYAGMCVRVWNLKGMNVNFIIVSLCFSLHIVKITLT